ncbi:protein kinase [Streptosporangium sp. NPDC051023]|uniref:protein kinase domain-containing protein n=1 Tax=Streptosporangium sp. NPDC051023 TaxID=3155410 RepID=UPI00344EC53D
MLSRLGEGGMGTVWLADDVMLGRRVALKEVVLAPYGEDLAVRTERALREARAAASIEHPGIVDIYDVFLEDGKPWIVMAYIRGRSLLELIGTDGLGERELARIGMRVLEALSAAHRAGVVHRDVKPANIVIGEGGRVFLVDFGIAQIDGQSSLTTNNALTGTPEFMAPERINGEEAGPPADLWSLGVTFFHALEGYSPFRRGNAIATMRAVVDVDLPSFSHRGRLSEAIVRLLERDPALRMGAAELTRVLRSIATTPARQPIPQPPPQPPPRLPQPPPPPRDHRPSPPPTDRQPPPPPRDHRPPNRPVDPPIPLTVDPQEAARRIGAMATEPAARFFSALPRDTAHQVLTLLEPQVAGEILLALPENKAAAVLTELQARGAGGMLERMAVRPSKAASVLQMMSAARAGRAVDYMSLDEASALVGVTPPGEAARILEHAHVRTTAGIVGALSGTPAAARLIEAMAVRRACDVLGYMSPATAATVLKALPGDHARRLLNGLDQRTHAHVLRHLKHS